MREVRREVKGDLSPDLCRPAWAPDKQAFLPSGRNDGRRRRKASKILLGILEGWNT